jgi:hypothetical protein
MDYIFYDWVHINENLFGCHQQHIHKTPAKCWRHEILKLMKSQHWSHYVHCANYWVHINQKFIGRPLHQHSTKLMWKQSWGSWNFKIDEVRIFVALLIGTSLTIKNYHINDTHKTEPTHILARTRMSLHWRNIHTWLVTKYQTFKFEEDITLVDTLSTRTSHTLHNILP